MVVRFPSLVLRRVIHRRRLWGGLPIGVFIGRFIVAGKEEARWWHWGVRVSQDAGRRHEDHGVVLAVFGDEQFGVPVQFTA